MRPFFFLPLVGLLAACASSPSLQGVPDFWKQAAPEIITEIQTLLGREGIPGLALTVYTPDLGSWTAGFGNTGGFPSSRVTPDTGFCMGSISKSFTAAAVVQLSLEGKLDLDAPFVRYVPEFTVKSRFPNTPPITVRHLLNHTSGLPAERLVNLFSGDLDDFRSTLAFVKDQYLSFPPGERTSYCNLGYALLGVLIERVTGQNFYEYQRASVLSLLDMRASDFDKSRISPALRSKADIGGWFLDEPAVYTAPAGSLWSTARDMERFFQSLDARWQNPSLTGPFSQEVQTLMRRTVEPGAWLDGNHSLGLGNFPDPSVWGASAPVLSHGGGTMGFHTLYLWIPEERIGVAVLRNRITNFALSSLVIPLLEKVRAARGQGKGFAKPPVPETKGLRLSAGTYHFALPEGMMSLQLGETDGTWDLEGPTPDSGTLSWQGETALIRSQNGMVREKVVFHPEGGRMYWVRAIKTSSTGREPRGLSVERGDRDPVWKTLPGRWAAVNFSPIEGVPLPPGRPEVVIKDLGSFLSLEMEASLGTGFQKVHWNFLPVGPREAIRMGTEDRYSGTTAFLELKENQTRIHYLGIIMEKVK